MTPMHANETALPLARLLGVRFTRTEPERVEAELTVAPELLTRPAVAHGGAIMALADTAGAVATTMNLGPGQATTTLESKTNFLAPAPVGSVLRAVTTPVHRGRRTQVWTTRIETDAGRLVAVTTQTQLVI